MKKRIRYIDWNEMKENLLAILIGMLITFLIFLMLSLWINRYKCRNAGYDTSFYNFGEVQCVNYNYEIMPLRDVDWGE